MEAGSIFLDEEDMKLFDEFILQYGQA